jgi:hypothetical protein
VQPPPAASPPTVDGRRDLFRYLTADEAADYLAIMDLFSATLLTDLSAADVAAQLTERGRGLSRDTAEGGGGGGGGGGGSRKGNLEACTETN